MTGPLMAHSPNTVGDWHRLDDHLDAVALDARRKAAVVGLGEVAEIAGRLHDIGKASPEFQRYLAGMASSVDHKGAGSVTASRVNPLASLLIEGHHGGMPDWSLLPARIAEREASALTHSGIAAARQQSLIPDPIDSPSLPAGVSDIHVRLVFSALVDADHADTERHFSPDDASLRPYAGEGIETLDLSMRAEQLSLHRDDSPLSAVRSSLADEAVAAARCATGAFAMEAMTGSGKTRSSLSFALAHAAHHGLRRVIIATPYMAITDQTAAVCRRLLGDEAVLEHHSSVGERVSDDPRYTMATQDWDAPVIVTTTVQLLESLASNRPAACRKLHRIAGSVIVLDEPQVLPVGVLLPTLSMLNDLIKHVGVTVLMATATMPPWSAIAGLDALGAPVKITPSPESRWALPERTVIDWSQALSPQPWREVAAAVGREPRVLTILNTRAQAHALVDEMGGDVLHLSAAMCAAHRMDVLREAYRRLAAGEGCRVVATQVIECGVDIDFPAVFRALGPLDRIHQAAGRCNREGNADQPGRVVVFGTVDQAVPHGPYRIASDVTTGMLRQGRTDIETYYHRAWSLQNLDAEGIQPLRKAFAMEQVAERFRVIDDHTEPVLVRYGEGGGEAEELLRRQVRPSRSALLRAQPYLVSLRPKDLETALKTGMAEETASGIPVWTGTYDSVLGLVLPR